MNPAIVSSGMPKIFHITILGLVLFSILTVYATIPSEDNFAKDADEGYYFKYANAVFKDGLKALPWLLKWYSLDEQARLHPNPLRIGYILCAVLWFKIFGVSFVSLAHLSFASFILFLTASFYFIKKYFGKDIAYLCALLFSSSSLMMAMARRALSDSFGNLLACLTVWLFLDFLTHKKVKSFITFLLFFCLCIISRESLAVLWLFFIAFFFIHKYLYKQKTSNIYLLGIVFIPFLMIGGFYTILFGGAKNIFLLVSALWKAHFQIEYSQYAVLFCSGPWYRYIIDYTLLSPLTMFLFIGYFFYLLFSREIEHNAFYFFMYFVAIFLGLVFLKHSKVVRFAINLDMILGLFSVLALYELFKQKDRHYQNCLVFIFCIATFFMNYFSFMDLFIAKGIYDPASYFLLKARGFIP